jgi:hypothetical protein
MLVICGDHPIHAGRFKRRGGPFSVPLVLGRNDLLEDGGPQVFDTFKCKPSR